MINNVVLVSGVQQVFHVLSPCKLLGNIEQSFLCYTVSPCWSSVLHITVCTSRKGSDLTRADERLQRGRWTGQEGHRRQEDRLHKRLLLLPWQDMMVQRTGGAHICRRDSA